MDRSHATLSAELERGAMRELLRSYHTVNHTYFGGALRPPVLQLETMANLGEWRSRTRTLTLSRELVLGHGWGVVVEVLKHEMAHQFVDETLSISDETAHGRTFRQVCERMGIDAAARGLPTQVRSEAENRVLERISKLLALAQSENQHEAEAAMKAAHALMLKHNLADASVAAAADEAGTPPERRYGFRHLGEPSGRIQEHERALANLLATHFFVDAIWVPSFRADLGKAGTVLEVCGTEANLALAEYVYTFMLETAERLWRAHQKAHRIRLNRDRRAYLAGVMAGFGEKLVEGVVEQRNAGLVWLPDAKLGGYMRKRHPRIRTVRYGSSANGDAHRDGRAAGRDIVLHRPVGSGPSGGPTRLLTR
jgi:predicted SprT family Zn-dependent metalloprotease